MSIGVFLLVAGIIGTIAYLITLIVYAAKKAPAKKQIGAAIAIAVCFVMFLVGIGLSASEEPAQAAEQTESGKTSTVETKTNKSSSQAEEDQALKVNYKTLYADYEANPINADAKYRDKKLQLTGSIATIDRDIGQSPYITFNIDTYGAKSIKMSFDNDEAVASLKKGQKVTVEGTCTGLFASVLVQISNCSIVK